MQKKPFRTHYDNLKVSQDAPQEVIKAAYKSLVQKYHPDRNPDEDAKRIFNIVRTSYEILSDPKKRSEHDRWISDKNQEIQTRKKHKVKSRTSRYSEKSSDWNRQEDNTEIFFSVYLRKYGVNAEELTTAIWEGKIQSRKLGSHIFVEDKPIRSSTFKKPYSDTFSRHSHFKKTQRNTSHSNPFNTNDESVQSSLLSKPLVIVAILILGFFAFFSFNNSSKNSNSNTIFTSGSTLSKMPLPYSSVISINSTKPALAPYTIIASGSESHLVKLKDATTGQEMVTIFVRAGEQVATKIPVGDYTQVYASGKIWYGWDFLFGNRTKFAKSLQILSFQQNGNQFNGHIVQLKQHSNGNLRSKPINQNEFR